MSQSRKTYASRLQKRITGTVDLVTEATGNFIDPKIPVGGGTALGLVYLNRMVAEKGLIKGLRAYQQWRNIKVREHTAESILENEVLMRRLLKNHPHHDRLAQQEAEMRAEKYMKKAIPGLTTFLSVVVKVISQNNKPLEIVPGLREGKATSSPYLYKVWKIIAKTIGRDTPNIKPELIANTNGALSYYFLPIPWERKDNVVNELRRGLEKYDLIPYPLPSTGPLSQIDFLEFQTFMHGNKLMPQLLITVVHYINPELDPTDLESIQRIKRTSNKPKKTRRRGYRSKSKTKKIK